MMNPEIMLFGKKIILPESGRVMTGGEYSGESCVESSNGSGGVVDCDLCLEGDREKVYVAEKHEDQEEEELCETAEQDEEDRNPIATDESHNNTNHPSSATNDDEYDNMSKTENEQSGSSHSQPKTTLKKPDKILPCPRCNSTDTKFCYFNNYNVNQPRHFCKGCQRYWTDGGTMRNVPVGAGRRKNKNYYARHLTIPDGLHHPIKLNKSTVLSFGEDAADDCKNAHPNGFLSPLVVPFTYPTIYPMGPFYYAQPAVWNQNVPCVSVHSQSPLGKHSRDGGEILIASTENSEGEAAKKRRVLESSVVVPKTLRIGDPEEAARSSIWSTLGIENRGGLLKALQSKGGERNSTVNASPLMLANPAALSRSISFQERI